MKTFKKNLFSIGFILSIALFSFPSFSSEEIRVSVTINDLKVLLRSNPDLSEQFTKGLMSQDKNSPWYRGSLDDFYIFFSEWLTFNPRLETAKKYIDKFKSFYVLPNRRGRVDEADKAIRDPRFSTWLKRFVEERGKYLDSPNSKYIIYDWASESDVSVGIYKIPQNGFNSFNEFFTRELKAGVRPIYRESNNQSFVSPADCEVWKDSTWLSQVGNVKVKGDEYNVGELIGDTAIAKKYINGEAIVCFLMPDNYHRFHSPVNGKITYKKEMDGYYFGAKGFVDHFHERRRSAYEIKTENGKHIAISSIGIATISSVELTRNIGDFVKKGDEIGHFSYGGSALVILFETGLLEELVFENTSNPYKYRTTKVLMGQKLGRLNTK